MKKDYNNKSVSEKMGHVSFLKKMCRMFKVVGLLLLVIFVLVKVSIIILAHKCKLIKSNDEAITE